MLNSLTSTGGVTLHFGLAAGERTPFAVEAIGVTVVRGRREVLRDVDLAVVPGEIVALQGANGAGKTTLLHCLAGALRPSPGEVYWFGEPAARTPTARRRIGFLGHDSGLYLTLTAEENLLFAARMYGIDRPAERAARLVGSVGLEQQTQQQAGRLSRGQRQRLALARAVLHEPALLLLDEPFTSLDDAGCAWLHGFLRQLRGSGCAIVIASHDIDEHAVDRIVALHEGRLLSCHTDGSRKPSYRHGGAAA